MGAHLLLDPTAAELALSDCSASVAALPCAAAVTHLSLCGVWPGDESADAVEICLDGCRVVDQALRAALAAAAAPEAGAALAQRAGGT